jgi:hypothetical protein
MVDVTNLETRQPREGYDTIHLTNSKPFSKYTMIAFDTAA